MAGALDDLRVVEMGQLLAGPFAGQLFADFGADVVKLEPPGVGDPMREWGREKPHGKSLWWPIVARGREGPGRYHHGSVALVRSHQHGIRDCGDTVHRYVQAQQPAHQIDLHPGSVGQSGP